MRTLSASLLAAQRSASASPYLRVLLFDRDLGVLRLRWERWYEGVEADGPCAAAIAGDGALLRARIDPGTGALTHQRVASPTASSVYSAWSTAGTVPVLARLGLGARGTRALLVTVRADGVSVEVRESVDSGATFGASVVVAVSGGAVTAVGGALLDSTGSAAVVYASGGVVYRVTRAGLGAWSAPVAWTNSLASVSALVMTADADYPVLVSGADASGQSGAWATRLGAGGFAPPNQWAALVPLALASPGTSVSYRATGLALADVARALLVESYSGGGAFDRVHLASGVGETGYSSFAWRDPAPLELTSAHGVGAVASADAVWLASPAGVWHAPLETAFEDLSDDIVEADLRQSPRGDELRLVLRNDHGRYAEDSTAPRVEPRSELWVSPGYRTSAGLESSVGPRFWVRSVTRQRGPGSSTVEVEAVGLWGRLEAWRAPRQLVWGAGTKTASQILGDIARPAGVRVPSSGSLEALTWQPAVTVRAGESAADAMRRLLAALPDEVRADGLFLELFDPQPSDAVTYEYGTDHPILAVETRATPSSTGWVRVLGASVVAEEVASAALLEGAGARVVVDDNVTTQARADARAQTLVRRAARAVERARIVVPVNAGQEVGDVVELTDATLGLVSRPYRVRALRLRFLRGRGAPRYELELSLTEV